MKQRFYLYRRGETYYLQDSRTGKQQSLETKDKQTALRLLEVKRQSTADVGFNQIMLKTCLTVQDPLLTKRAWESVMEQMQTHGKDSTRNPLRPRDAVQSFSAAPACEIHGHYRRGFSDDPQSADKVSVAHYLKRLHNLAIGLGLAGACRSLAPRLWPKPHFKPKRGITLAEHQRILAAEEECRTQSVLPIALGNRVIAERRRDAHRRKHRLADAQPDVFSDENRRAGATRHQQGTGRDSWSSCRPPARCFPRFPRRATTPGQRSFIGAASCLALKASRFIPTATLGRNERE